MRHPGRMGAMAIIAVAVAFMGGCSFFGDAIGGDAAHGKVVARTHCASCHGPDGNSPTAIYPRLAGQKAGYLYRQLSAFRSGARPSKVMAALVTPLSDGDMRDVAVFFAGQARQSDPPGPPGLMVEGRQLFLSGSPDGRVPACAACHAPRTGFMGHMGGGMGRGGMSMMGMMMGRRAPSLYGQHAVYVVGQLRAFADGTRPAMMMGRIAGAMTAQQAQAVADYVAAHP